jgi:hypothetical protein
MIPGAASALAALAALAPLFTALTAPLEAQSRLHAGAGVGAGLVRSVADTRASYGAGPGGKAELAFGMSGSPWSVRVEAWYLRLKGAHASDLGFPSLNVLAFDLSAVRRLGRAARFLSPYVMAGAGAHNLQDALPFAPYRTRLGLHAGAGADVGRGRLRAFVEGRVTHVSGDPPTDFMLLIAGMRWGL